MARSLANVIPADDTDQQSTNSQQTTDSANSPDQDAAHAQQGTQPAEEETGQQGNRGANRKQTKSSGSKTSSGSKARRSSTQSAAQGNEPAKTTSADAGRPRIPKPGPVTRVTVDLAVTEQRALEKLAGQLGRATDRDRGKNRIYPQHLMRVAVRRLLTDEAFRQAVTNDLQDGRDTLKRERK